MQFIDGGDAPGTAQLMLHHAVIACNSKTSYFVTKPIFSDQTMPIKRLTVWSHPFSGRVRLGQL